MKPIKIRVQSPEHSETIQKMLFTAGCYWGRLGREQGCRFTNSAFLYVDTLGIMTHEVDDERYFEQHGNTEVDFDWLMPDTIEVEGRTYDKDEVLARLSTLKPIGEY